MKGIVMHCRRMEYKDIQKSTWPKGIATTKTGSASQRNVVVVLTCIERDDTEEYLEAAAARVSGLIRNFYNENNVFVMPFAHLSNKLEHASRAIPLIAKFKELLEREGYNVGMGTFGSDKDFLIDIIGHRASVSYFEFPFSKKEKPKQKPAEVFTWDPILYSAIVGRTENKLLRSYEEAETKLLQKISSPGKTLIEVGAGSGRVVEAATPLFEKIIGVESNDEMHKHLIKNYGGIDNVEIVKGDANELTTLIPKQKKPIITCLQNTFGTWEGDWRKGLSEMVSMAKGSKGELVISLFSRRALPGWGLQMYKSLEPMIGEYDPEKSNLIAGEFCTKAGYSSHWWGKNARKEIKKALGDANLSIIGTDNYWIIHADYSNSSTASSSEPKM